MYNIVKLFTDLPVPFNMIVLIVLITSCTGIVTSLAKQSRRYMCHRLELNFKRELLEQGLEIDEIERILRVKSDTTESV